MGYFSSITVRENGQKVLHSWWNALRTAGIAVENFLGGGYIVETNFALANNTGSPANVTGLIFDKILYKSAIIQAEIRRKTSTTEYVSSGFIKVLYKDAGTLWEIIDELGGDDDGVTLTITTAGQVQYVSDNMGGSGYVGTIKFKAITFSV